MISALSGAIAIAKAEESVKIPACNETAAPCGAVHSDAPAYLPSATGWRRIIQGTARFNSSNQLSTTTMDDAVAVGPASNLIMRKRFASGEAS